MKGCKEVGNLLVAYAANELSDSEKKLVNEHLETCGACREEFRKTGDVFRGIETLREEDTVLGEAVNWRTNARELGNYMIRRSRRVKKPFFMKWPILAPALASVFVMGVLLGYLLFHTDRSAYRYPVEKETAVLSFSHIESTWARKEVLEFLKQSRLLFTQLMFACDRKGMVLPGSRIEKDQIDALLTKSKFLTQDLHDPRLMASRNLLAEIELLLFEMSTLGEQVSCRRIQRLQQNIRQERLFFKIRLIEKELSRYEV